MATFAAAVGVILCVIGPAAGERAKPKTHTITIEGMRFQPETLTVARGDSVVWANNDLVPHTATSDAGSFDSQVIEPEKSWTFTARRTGDFAYICTLHPTMKAILHVK